MLVHAMNDKSMPLDNTLRLTEALVDANVQFDMQLYPNRDENFTMWLTQNHVFGKVMTPKVRVPKAVRTPKDAKVEISDDTEFHKVQLPANASAAIAMALHLYYSDVHDQDSHVITIKKVERRYSPWSAKIYGINNLVR